MLEIYDLNLIMYDRLLNYYKAFNQSKYELAKYIQREIASDGKVVIANSILKDNPHKFKLENFNFGLLKKEWIYKNINWSEIKMKLTRAKKKYFFSGTLQHNKSTVNGLIISLSGGLNHSRYDFIIYSILGYYVYEKKLLIAYLAQTNKKHDVIVFNMLIGE